MGRDDRVLWTLIGIVVAAIVLLIIGGYISFGTASYGGIMAIGVSNPSQLFVGIPQTLNVNIVSPNSPDADFSDGNLRKIFAITVLTDAQGNLIKTLIPQEEMTSAVYSKSVQWTPTAVGQYYVVGFIAETTNTWNITSQSWTGWTTPIKVADDKVSLIVSSGSPGSAPTAPTFDILNLFAGILNWFKNLLGII